MNIYDATMKAAGWIERNPHLYNFNVSHVPTCDSPGCVLGWVAHFAGFAPGEFSYEAVAEKFGLPPGFEGGRWCAFGDLVRATVGAPGYTSDHTVAVKFLRLYAAKHFTPPKPVQQPPDWQAMARKLASSPALVEA